MQLMQQMQQMQQAQNITPQQQQATASSTQNLMAMLQQNPVFAQNQQLMQMVRQTAGMTTGAAVGQRVSAGQSESDREGRLRDRESRDDSYGRNRDDYRSNRDFRRKDDGYGGYSGSRDRNRSPLGYEDRGRSRDRRDGYRGESQQRGSRLFRGGGGGDRNPRYDSDRPGPRNFSDRDDYGRDRRGYDRGRGQDAPPQWSNYDRPPRNDDRPWDRRRPPGDYRRNDSPGSDRSYSQGPPWDSGVRGRPHSNPPSRNSSNPDLQLQMDFDAWRPSSWKPDEQQLDRQRISSESRYGRGRGAWAGPSRVDNSYQANCKAFFSKDQDAIPSRYRSPPRKLSGSGEPMLSPTASPAKPSTSGQRFTYTKGKYLSRSCRNVMRSFLLVFHTFIKSNKALSGCWLFVLDR